MRMIYGANGYTGRLAARDAKDHDLSPVVAGRHGDRIRALADELGFESRVFDLADAAVAAKNLDGIAAVLHCAGPYTLTAEAGVKATLKVIDDRLAPGTYTPSMAFGADYVLALEGVILSRVAL